MKENRFIRKRSNGELAVGHMLMEFGTRGMAQIHANAGLDFVLLDTEHASFTISDIADLVAWYGGTGVAPFVRIPQIEYHFMARALDAGALGIMVPNVKTADQARAIVEAVKYAPLGGRGVALGGPLTSYRTVDPGDFLDYSNRNTTVICQIESEEGLSNLDDIAGTTGVDVLWVGHFDLTQSMGIPGQFDNERFRRGLEQVIGACRTHGLGAGIQPGSVSQARSWIALGFTIISYASDYALYQRTLSDGVSEIRASI